MIFVLKIQFPELIVPNSGAQSVPLLVILLVAVPRSVTIIIPSKDGLCLGAGRSFNGIHLWPFSIDKVIFLPIIESRS